MLLKFIHSIGVGSQAGLLLHSSKRFRILCSGALKEGRMRCLALNLEVSDSRLELSFIMGRMSALVCAFADIRSFHIRPS